MRSPLRSLFLLLASIVALAAPTPASAASFWVTLTNSHGEIAQGVNGFQWFTHGGPFNTYGAHCDALPGNYVAGSYCILRWNVPPGMTAGNASTGGGIANGTYRVGNTAFLLRTTRPGGNPDYVTDSTGQRSTHGPYGHGWGALGAYTETGLRTNAATTTGSTITNWFHHDTFTVLLNDPSNPVIAAVSVGGSVAGWLGPGCHGANYAWSDSGSQMWTTNLVNLSTGAGIHGWQHNPGIDVVASGVPTASHNTCVPAPGTGTYVFRTTGWDRSGNAASYDFNLSFDLTAPTVGVPQYAGSAVADGRVFNGTHDAYKPKITWAVADPHSGVASVVTRFKGVTVPSTFAGGIVTLNPADKLPLGTHQLQIVVADRVGNQTTVNRNITIADIAPPTVTVFAPAANGSNDPVLDVAAQDDYSGVAPASWRVFVNGEALPVASGSARLLASIGRLANGTHTIEIRIRDASDNERVHSIQHIASGDPYTPPGMTGIFVLGSPSVVDQDELYHVTAIAVRNGRPISTGRYELSKVGGDGTVIAGKQSSPDGYVDMVAQLSAPGPLQLALTGSQLASAQFDYTYRRIGEPDYCAAHPQHTACQTSTGGGGTGGGGSTGTTGGDTGSGTTGGGTTGGGTTGGGGSTTGTSGGPNDHVAPVFRVTRIATRKGQVIRTRKLPIRLATNERTRFTILPIGSSVTRVTYPRRQTRIVQLRVTGKLLKRLRAARGRPIVVRIRVTAVDGNKNVRRKIVTMRVRG